MDVLVDNITGYAFISFMDGYAGYSQIKMT